MGNRATSATNILYYALGITTLLVTFLLLALPASQLNNDHSNTDQGAYLNESQIIANNLSNTLHLPRNRMPLYPLLLASVYHDNDDIFFERAKILNIAITVFCLLLLGGIAKSYLSSSLSFLFFIIISFSVYIYRAPYVQAESLFYLLFFISFLFFSLLLHRPSLKASVTTGIISGLAFLTKFAMIPMIIIALSIFIIKNLTNTSCRRIVTVKYVMSFLVSLLLIIGPYLYTSKQIHGQYLFNYNSTYNMWYDNWEQALAYEKLYQIDSKHTLPDHIAPGPLKYLQSHNARDIFLRVDDGLEFYMKLLTGQITGLFYGYSIFLAVTVLTLLATCFLDYRQIHSLWIYKWNVLFAISTALVYGLLAVWYHPIAAGNRFILITYVPFIFSIFYAIQLLLRSHAHKSLLNRFIFIMIIISIISIHSFTAQNIFMVNGAN